MFELGECSGRSLCIASFTQRPHALDLRLLQRRIDPQHIYRRLFLNLESIYTNHHLFLRFNSKLEKRFTRITLAAGSQPPAPVTLPDGDGLAGPDRVVIPLAPLAPGVYVLRYRVLAVDGHITEGALRFTVGPAAQ